MEMGEGVNILKPTQGGVSFGRFSGSEKKENTSESGKGTLCSKRIVLIQGFKAREGGEMRPSGQRRVLCLILPANSE